MDKIREILRKFGKNYETVKNNRAFKSAGEFDLIREDIINQAFSQITALIDEEIKMASAHQELDDFTALKRLVEIDEKRLREYLWLSHGHEGLYGDDGEMQCNQPNCGLDFKRDDINKIIEKLSQSDIYKE